MKNDPLVPRSEMPQVDEKDLGKLIVFMAKGGYGITAGVAPPSSFHSHQSVDSRRAAAMPEEVRQKPIIVTKANEIIDGNYRNEAHRIADTAVPFIRFNCSFVEALDMLAVFPFAYELTALTPERN